MSTQTDPTQQNPKPVSTTWQPGQTRFPSLTAGRRVFRYFFKFICRAAVFIFTKMTVHGMENYPGSGPALIVMNHLGDPDIVLVQAALPDFPEIIGKIELREIPILRIIGDGIGVIWIHRGQPDRRAMKVCLDALHQGRRVIIAPEGQESVSGALEMGTEGAAFLVRQFGQPLPIIPITLTGSEFRLIENAMGRLQRTKVEVTIGQPYFLAKISPGREGLAEATRVIMESLARQLTVEYRGVYSYVEVP